jgi:hypothetical protein
LYSLSQQPALPNALMARNVLKQNPAVETPHDHKIGSGTGAAGSNAT